MAQFVVPAEQRLSAVGVLHRMQLPGIGILFLFTLKFCVLSIYKLFIMKSYIYSFHLSSPNIAIEGFLNELHYNIVRQIALKLGRV